MRVPFTPSLSLLLVSAGLLAIPTGVLAQEGGERNPPSAPLSALAGDSAAGDTTSTVSPVARYREVIPDSADSDPGLFGVHRVGTKYFFEIPLALLGRDILLQTRITQAATGAGYGGEQESTAVTRWERRDDRILLRLIGYENFAADSLPIAEAVRSSNFSPILFAFRIEAFSPDSSAVVIDADTFFGSDTQVISISRARREQYQVMGMNSDLSYIESIRSFPENIEVRRVVTYSASNTPTFQVGGTISYQLGHSLLLLPEEPMALRGWDERVGYASIRRFDFGAQSQRLMEERFIRRWRLEPSDSAAYARGELVEPVRPIVIYLDPATPERWRPYLKEGIEDWQVAFEAAGFRNAIRAMDPPTREEDPDFDPADARYSVIRYFASPVQNASGPYFFDPRSGEILGTHVVWHHNYTSLLRNWFLVQTGAANMDARQLEPSDEIMGELIRYVTAHEVGHALGLVHNMQANAGVRIEDLRSRWVCENGTSASIMSYARFNYVAQPGDDTCFIPRIGPYDRWAIEWGYRQVPGPSSFETEVEVLENWLDERRDNPLYRFGDGTSSDPGSAAEALGNDAVAASEYGIANLRRVLEGLPEWTFDEGEGYAQLREVYLEVLNQWNRYSSHVALLVGGVDRTLRVQGDAARPFVPVPEDRQREALEYLEREVFRSPLWLIDPDILLRIEEGGIFDRLSTYQKGALEQILETAKMKRMIEIEILDGEAAYSLEEMLSDLRRAIWSDLDDPERTDPLRRSLQRGYVARIEYLLEAPESNSTDIAPLARGELLSILDLLDDAHARTSHDLLLLHIEDLQTRISGILEGRG